MTDLRTLLTDTLDDTLADTGTDTRTDTRPDAAGRPGAAAPADCVEADLARGRRALRRHRLQRTAPSAVLTVVAASVLAVTLTNGVTGGVTGRDQVAAAPTASASAAAPVTVPATALVAYTGVQPAGYTLDKVPAGWVVSDSGPLALVIAPEGVPSGDPGSFVGRIAVSLQASVRDPQGTVLDVGGARGVLVAHQGGGSTLFVQQPDGAQLGIQVWAGLGWDAAQIVDFAVGVHVTAAAEPVFG